MFEYLGRIAPSRKLALDCGTGSGQAAAGLAAVFDCVIATDASEKQIANAQSYDKVEYRVAPAESSSLESDTIDLLMVAQALHWFELDCFYAETRRILKPQGVLAATAYNLLQISPGIDQVVNRYYYDIVGPFWPPERALVERFTELPFPFPEQNPPSFQMNANWNVEQLLGYLRSWSSTERFIAATNRNPLEQIASDLGKAWGDPQRKRRIMWPLVLRVGIKSMAEPTKE
jgi:SAM-dependent methyltransferase